MFLRNAERLLHVSPAAGPRERIGRGRFRSPAGTRRLGWESPTQGRPALSQPPCEGPLDTDYQRADDATSRDGNRLTGRVFSVPVRDEAQAPRWQELADTPGAVSPREA